MAKKARDTHKFVIVPSDGELLFRTSFKDRDGYLFYLDERKEVKEIVFNKRPDTKNADPVSGFRFSHASIHHPLTSRAEIIGERKVTADFAHDFPVKNKKAIIRIMKRYLHWDFDYEKYSWAKIEEFNLIYGPLVVNKKVFSYLGFYTSERTGSSIELSKAEFDRYRADGVPKIKFEELMELWEFSAPIFSDYCDLHLNGRPVDGFPAKLARLVDTAISQIATDTSSKVGALAAKTRVSPTSRPKRPYLLVHQEFNRRSYFDLEVLEEFDLERLEIELKSVKLHPDLDAIDTFMLFYRDQDDNLLQFDFNFTKGVDEQSTQVFDTRGVPFDVVVIEDDADDEGDLDVF